jgi:hypothetical protein
MLGHAGRYQESEATHGREHFPGIGLHALTYIQSSLSSSTSMTASDVGEERRLPPLGREHRREISSVVEPISSYIVVGR